MSKFQGGATLKSVPMSVCLSGELSIKSGFRLSHCKMGTRGSRPPGKMQNLPNESLVSQQQRKKNKLFHWRSTLVDFNQSGRDGNQKKIISEASFWYWTNLARSRPYLMCFRLWNFNITEHLTFSWHLRESWTSFAFLENSPPVQRLWHWGKDRR